MAIFFLFIFFLTSTAAPCLQYTSAIKQASPAKHGYHSYKLKYGITIITFRKKRVRPTRKAGFSS